MNSIIIKSALFLAKAEIEGFHKEKGITNSPVLVLIDEALESIGNTEKSKNNTVPLVQTCFNKECFWHHPGDNECMGVNIYNGCYDKIITSETAKNEVFLDIPTVQIKKP